MTDQSGLAKINALDRTISLRYPDATRDQIVVFRDRVMDYISRNLEQGFDIAHVKREGDQTVIRILKFIEEDINR